jgi:hypothetical protein
MKRQIVLASFKNGLGATIVSATAPDALTAIDRAYGRLMRLGAVWPLDVHLVVTRLP